MSVIRVNKNSDYTVMSNYHLQDKNISLAAKGLLSQMLSLPDEWDYTVAGLAHINKEGSYTISSTLSELKQGGYLVVTKLLPNETKSGRIEYIYDIYETPFCQKQEGEKQDLVLQGVVSQGVEAQDLVFQPQKNTNRENTKEENTKELNTNNRESAKRRFTPPSEDEVRQYIEEKGYKVNAKKFVSYYEANGWKVGKNPMKNWKAAVSNWEARDRDAVVKPQAPKDVRPKASSFDTKDFFEASLKRAYKEG